MADLTKHARYRRISFSNSLRFNVLPEDPTDLDLVANDYYRGFRCPVGHEIRDSNLHWCYECVKKIQSNICCFDINYITPTYQARALELVRPLLDIDPRHCVPYAGGTDNKGYPARIYFPSYRAAFGSRVADRLTIHKALYTMLWGDIGKMSVTRTCGDPLCINPLHMTSSWHITTPPRSIQFLVTEYDASKIIKASNSLRKGKHLGWLLASQYKRSIRDPRASNYLLT